jgi:hypothetical protein
MDIQHSGLEGACPRPGVFQGFNNLHTILALTSRNALFDAVFEEQFDRGPEQCAHLKRMELWCQAKAVLFASQQS